MEAYSLNDRLTNNYEHRMSEMSSDCSSFESPISVWVRIGDYDSAANLQANCYLLCKHCR